MKPCNIDTPVIFKNCDFLQTNYLNGMLCFSVCIMWMYIIKRKWTCKNICAAYIKN